jgi:hypothetical protein
VACTLVLALLCGAPGQAVAAPLSISVQGNHFVNGAGETVRLLGVDHASFEYACEEGYAYDDGNMDAADAAAIAAWHATAVRVPLNEDCWLGINGEPSNSQDPDPPLTVAGYRQAVEDYVTDLDDAGLYVILDLHWSAPGTLAADGQRPMPDDHSADFWTSVASTFKNDPGVVFDAFNEPFSPDQVNDPNHPVSWDCWENGGCAVPEVNDSTPLDGRTYTAVGMQALVTAIRQTGATQPILLGGLSYANDLSGWLAHEPSDPDHQLAASFHNYPGEACAAQSCWDAQIAPVAAQVPVVTGEFDQDVCQSSSFDADYMNWADQHGISYLAWGWWVLSAQEISDDGCSAYYLITDPGGTPAAPNGVNLHDHLTALAASAPAPAPTGPGPGAPAPRLRAFSAQVKPGGSSVSFVLRSDQNTAGRLSGRTAGLFGSGGRSHRRAHVSLGSARFTLTAGKTKTVVLKLVTAARKLLARRHSLKVQISVTLANTAKRQAVTLRTVTLKLPARRRH